LAKIRHGVLVDLEKRHKSNNGQTNLVHQ